MLTGHSEEDGFPVDHQQPLDKTPVTPGFVELSGESPRSPGGAEYLKAYFRKKKSDLPANFREVPD